MEIISILAAALILFGTKFYLEIKDKSLTHCFACGVKLKDVSETFLCATCKADEQ